MCWIDASVPDIDLGRTYDWVVSLEVGEHIHKERMDIFMDNLRRHAKKGVIMSWGRPGQAGFGHINPLTRQTVARLMEARGLRLDKTRSAKLRHAITHLVWLKKNVQVFYVDPPPPSPPSCCSSYVQLVASTQYT